MINTPYLLTVRLSVNMWAERQERKMSIRAIRGATTANENTREAVFEATIEMVQEMIEANGIKTSDMVDFIFTVTPDLTAVFPAAAVRKMGITDVPLLDMAAPDIDGALKMCIRVMLHINTDIENKELNHVYLRGAKALRPDLVKTKKISVAIDGPAGAGKSSVAKQVAKDMGYVYIDTGAMYRAVAVWAIENGIDIKNDTQKLINSLNEIKIDVSYDENVQRMHLNGKDVTERIRENDASMGASAVATIPEVRVYLVDMQRKMGEKGGVIMDGRDIGTAVLPDAELKIYLTASVEERAMRRYKEYIEKGIACDYEQLKADVISRDENDMNRKASPLRQAEDAILLDTTDKTFIEAVDTIKEWIKNTEAKI